MMTQEQAGRRLCELRGQDPDELISHGARATAEGVVPAVLLRSPRWQLAAFELGDALLVAQVVREYREAQG